MIDLCNPWIQMPENSELSKPANAAVSSMVNVETRQKYALNGQTVTIGRAEDSVICLKDDVYVSTHHAEIYFADGLCWLRDAGSRNGTMKNSQPVSEDVMLEPGDVITIGRTRFELS